MGLASGVVDDVRRYVGDDITDFQIRDSHSLAVDWIYAQVDTWGPSVNEAVALLTALIVVEGLPRHVPNMVWIMLKPHLR